MPLTGEYEPSAASWAREHVDLYERSGGTEGTENQGRPVIILTPLRKDYLAREVHDSERAAWWERAVATWPDYAEYQKQTARTIPVFVLTPIDA